MLLNLCLGILNTCILLTKSVKVSLMSVKLDKPIIPIFFAVDDNYAPLLAVTLRSMVDNVSENNLYKVYVLIKDLRQDYIDTISSMAKDNVTVEFVNLAKELDKVQSMFYMRDYYSQATYYRFFISDLFPQYSKVLYLDSDLIILDDIAKLFNIPLDGNLIVAIREETMTEYQPFGQYSKKVIGLNPYEYFNAGIMVMDTVKFRKEHVMDKFLKMLKEYKFYVAQDQDYLNIICKGRVKFADLGWNKAAFKNVHFDDKNLKIVHYKINWKPWHYKGTLYEEQFWEYAKKTPYYDYLLDMRDNYSEEKKNIDSEAFAGMKRQVYADIADPKSYLNDQKRKYKYLDAIRLSYNRTKIKSRKSLRKVKSLFDFKSKRSVYGSRKK